MSDPRKDLPPAHAANFLERVRETVQVYLGNRGDGMDRGLTVRDLYEAGLIDISANYLRSGGRIPPGITPGAAGAPSEATQPPRARGPAY